MGQTERGGQKEVDRKRRTERGGQREAEKKKHQRMDGNHQTKHWDLAMSKDSYCTSE